MYFNWYAQTENLKLPKPLKTSPIVGLWNWKVSNFDALKWLNFQMRLLKYGLQCKIEKPVAHCTLHIFFGIFCATKINVWLTNPSHNCATNSEIKWTAQFYIQLVISQIWEEEFYFFGHLGSQGSKFC